LSTSLPPSSSHGRMVTVRPEPFAKPDGHVDQDGESVRPGFFIPEDFGTISDSLSRFNRPSRAPATWGVSSDPDELPTQTLKYQLGKRIFDLVLAVAIAPLVGILLGIISAAIAGTSGGSPFYRQRRVGQYGREFLIWKFRTMRQNADEILAEHLRGDPIAKNEWLSTRKLHDDPRITWIGGLLRKTSLDELPQILNVFSGEMSFVGPRPIVQEETVKYAARLAYYLTAVPGITGLWQVSGRCDLSYEQRVTLDESYVCKWTIGGDVWILLKTPLAVCCRVGAY
jgi:exopolysaccharide production protein ExoY